MDSDRSRPTFGQLSLVSKKQKEFQTVHWWSNSHIKHLNAFSPSILIAAHVALLQYLIFPFANCFMRFKGAFPVESNHTLKCHGTFLYWHTGFLTIGIFFNLDLPVIFTSSFFQKTLGGVDFSIWTTNWITVVPTILLDTLTSLCVLVTDHAMRIWSRAGFVTDTGHWRLEK